MSEELEYDAELANAINLVQEARRLEIQRMDRVKAVDQMLTVEYSLVLLGLITDEKERQEISDRFNKKWQELEGKDRLLK